MNITERTEINSYKAKTCLKWNAYETAITSYWGLYGFPTQMLTPNQASLAK